MLEMQRLRFAYVDLIRGLCAMAVLLSHFGLFAHVDEGLHGRVVSPPFYSVLAPLYHHGYLAVQMFWIISGFVFVMAYQHEGKDISARRFAVWRFSRLYPLHLATFVLIAILQEVSISLLGDRQIYKMDDLPNAVYHLLFVSGWLGDGQDSYNGVIWSVSVEIFAYAAFLIYMKFLRPNLTMLAFLVVAAFIGHRLTGSLILMCVSFFFVGCGAARVTSVAHAKSLTALISAALVGLGASTAAAITFFAIGEIGMATWTVMYGVFAAVLLCCASADLYLPSVPKGMRWIGDTTYAVYLLHMPLLVALLIFAKASHWSEPIMQGSLVFLIYVAAVLALSLLTYRYFEMPAQNWLRKRLAPSRHHKLKAVYRESAE